MKESTVQKKIIDYLEKNGYLCIKVVVATKSGIADIIACSPHGDFVAIEVKASNNKPTPLQDHFLKEVNKRSGTAFWANDLDTVKRYLDQ